MSRDLTDGKPQTTVLRMTATVLEWTLVIVLLGITALNVTPEVAAMIGFIILATIATIVILKHRKRVRSRVGSDPRADSHRRYRPEHPTY